MMSPTVKRLERPPPPPTPPKPERHPQQQQQHGADPGMPAVPSETPDEEQVVMTPLGKTNTSTVLLIERKLIQSVGERTHVAGGDHRGIIINKTAEGRSVNAPASPCLPYAQLPTFQPLQNNRIGSANRPSSVSSSASSWSAPTVASTRRNLAASSSGSGRG